MDEYRRPFSSTYNSLIPALQLHSIQLPASKSAGIETTASVGAIAFDTFQELLWIGDGHASSLKRPFRVVYIDND